MGMEHETGFFSSQEALKRFVSTGKLPENTPRAKLAVLVSFLAPVILWIAICMYIERESHLLIRIGDLKGIWNREGAFLKKSSEVHVAIFGGSTSVGGGSPLTTDMKLWHNVWAEGFFKQAGQRVTVHNRAKGAMDANFFSSCFSRFGFDTNPKLVFLEFGINHGNVLEFVEVIKDHMPGAKIVIINQFSCADGKVSYTNHSSIHADAHFDFFQVFQKLGQNQTSICNGNLVDALFKSDHHHLSDFGHLFLGQALLELPLIKQISRASSQKSSIPKGRARYKCFMTDGETEEQLRDQFIAQNWDYTAVDPSREDKTGFITTSKDAFLRAKDINPFTKIHIFTELGPDKGDILAFCGSQFIGAIHPYDPEYRIIRSLEISIDFVCTEALILRTNSTISDGTIQPEYHKVFGVVLY